MSRYRDCEFHLPGSGPPEPAEQAETGREESVCFHEFVPPGEKCRKKPSLARRKGPLAVICAALLAMSTGAKKPSAAAPTAAASAPIPAAVPEAPAYKIVFLPVASLLQRTGNFPESEEKDPSFCLEYAKPGYLTAVFQYFDDESNPVLNVTVDDFSGGEEDIIVLRTEIDGLAIPPGLTSVETAEKEALIWDENNHWVPGTQRLILLHTKLPDGIAADGAHEMKVYARQWADGYPDPEENTILLIF